MIAESVNQLNIERFEQMLLAENLPQKQAMIVRLLDEERSKETKTINQGPIR